MRPVSLPTMPDGYRLVPSTPPVDAYLRLRSESGLSPKTEAQAVPALAGTWWGCHVVHEATSEVVAMGRVIGDGGWHFHIADMATLPDHQRRGLGDLVMTALLDRIRAAAPPDAYVTLMADPPGRRLYAQHGFTEDRDASIGMARWLGEGV
jgi:GNAT superfamily N-acetyltransferase